MPDLNHTRVPLPEDVVDYLQELDYEVNGLSVLHTHALNAGTPGEKTAEIRARFLEKYQEYQLAKQEVFSTYGGEFQGKKLWISFQEGVMYVGDGRS